MLFEKTFHQTRLQAIAYPKNRQRLHRALIDPAGRYLRATGDTHLHFRGIRQVDNVVNHAVGFAPLGLAAGALKIVALFRADNTAVALGQALKTGVAIALIKAFAGFAVAVNTVDLALKGEL